MKRQINGKTYSKTVGVKEGLALIDKHGNIGSSGIDPDSVANFPEGASVGDILSWGENGAEWITPQAGTKKYLHQVCSNTSALWQTFNIVTDSPDPIDTSAKAVAVMEALKTKIVATNIYFPFHSLRVYGGLLQVGRYLAVVSNQLVCIGNKISITISGTSGSFSGDPGQSVYTGVESSSAWTGYIWDTVTEL